MDNIQRIIPPKEVFQDDGLVLSDDPYLHSSEINNAAVRADFPEEGGMLIYRQGDKFPAKGWPFREAIMGVDIAKRSALNIVRFLTCRPIRYFLPLFFILPGPLKKKVIHAAIEHYAEFTHVMFLRTGAYLKPQYFCTMVREIHRVGMEMAGEDEAMKNFVMTVCMILEFDDAYRYRVQDLVGSINPHALLSDPSRELVRVFEIASERDHATNNKFGTFTKLIPFLFRIRCVRQPLLTFFSKLAFPELELDENDWYKCLIWGGHDFGGISFKERLSMRTMIDAEWQANQGLTPAKT